jgi:hypothetical protein
MSDEHQRGVKIYWLGAYAPAVRCKDDNENIRRAYEELHRQRERSAMKPWLRGMLFAVCGAYTAIILMCAITLLVLLPWVVLPR